MRGYTHLSVYSGISLCHRRLYTWLCVTVCGYTCIFTLKVSIYTVLRTPALTLHHVVTHMVIPLHVWLYIKHIVIHIYLYSNIPLYRMRLYTWLCITVYSYTRNFAYIYTYIHVIYTYVIVPYIVFLFQHSPLCLVTAFSKYVSTLFLYVHMYVYRSLSNNVV